MDREGEGEEVVGAIDAEKIKGWLWWLGNPSRFGLGLRMLAEVLRAVTGFSSTA